VVPVKSSLRSVVKLGRESVPGLDLKAKNGQLGRSDADCRIEILMIRSIVPVYRETVL
jgi:hypothetical protein